MVLIIKHFSNVPYLRNFRINNLPPAPERSRTGTRPRHSLEISPKFPIGLVGEERADADECDSTMPTCHRTIRVRGIATRTNASRYHV